MKKETLEEAAENYANKWYESTGELSVFTAAVSKNSFKHGANWQAQRMYSEEEVINLLNKREDYLGTEPSIFDYSTNEQWFEQFKGEKL